MLLAITAVHILFNRGYVANYVCRAICAAERPRARARERILAWNSILPAGLRFVAHVRIENARAASAVNYVLQPRVIKPTVGREGQDLSRSLRLYLLRELRAREGISTAG